VRNDRNFGSIPRLAGDQMNEDAGLVPLSKPYAPKWMIHKSIHLKPNQMKSSWERFMFPEDGKKKK
jgi:hypothetical protein